MSVNLLFEDAQIVADHDDLVKEDFERDLFGLQGLVRRMHHEFAFVPSQTELLDHVWDAAADTDPNVVEVYVGYLRRKIDAPFGRQTLSTVRGAGYRVIDDLARTSGPQANGNGVN